ncbi:MAG: hypothetical protein IPN06_05165 [Burkholderiales bacterium]|nr:hypothetical protein [Burkholderiales bacterium]
MDDSVPGTRCSVKTRNLPASILGHLCGCGVAVVTCFHHHRKVFTLVAAVAHHHAGSGKFKPRRACALLAVNPAASKATTKLWVNLDGKLE